MYKSALLLVVIAFFLCGSIVAAEDEMCVPMGEIPIAKLAQEPKRSEVVFPHNKHFSYTCQQCHHKWDSQTSITGCQTSGCHDLASKPDTSDSAELVRYYKEAYHSMCIGCHKDLKQQYEAVENSLMGATDKLPVPGPTSCNKCHPKE